MHIKQRTILKALMWMWVSIGGVSTTDGDIDNGGPRVVVRIKGSIDDCVTGVTASETPPAASTGVTGLNLDGVASTLSVAECVATRYHTGESWPPYPSFSMNTSYAECISRRQHSFFTVILSQILPRSVMKLQYLDSTPPARNDVCRFLMRCNPPPATRVYPVCNN
jgi:hypothetical protein